jgi:hypothetical protein
METQISTPPLLRNGGSSNPCEDNAIHGGWWENAIRHFLGVSCG